MDSSAELPVLTAAVGVRGQGDDVHVIFPKGTPIPIRKELELELAEEQQTTCTLVRRVVF